MPLFGIVRPAVTTEGRNILLAERGRTPAFAEASTDATKSAAAPIRGSRQRGARTGRLPKREGSNMSIKAQIPRAEMMIKRTKVAAPGKLTIRLTQLAPASAADPQHAALCRLFSEGKA